ncbi:MAG: 2-C-methyl-D-erythritol 4-phosphate cytidylyltransferase [Clostridia bacterium]|nr:2-C-methyl-D-erythritol 4-phosphate cytidylyltransferase [Clostridia bacterium]MBR4013942.1 2-C-methyl-D-erythritol 4-phosphate cytidylyltransferase [Clostridia bacterium]
MCIKKITGALRAISGTPHPKNFTSAIIAAAGLSERFGGDVTKQMTEIRGVPVLIHTLKAFEQADCIHEIVVVAKLNEISAWEILCREHGITKVTKIVQGGFTRQESVLCGLDAVDKKSKFVAISDGARCLITPDIINSVCRSAYKYKAATAAHRSTDTVKIADKKGFIDSTADRDTVWLAQTPQVFKTKLYRAAAYTALKKGFTATDDNSLVENIGHPIRLVECGAQNIKITTREDIAIAEGVLCDREKIAALAETEDE